MKIVLPNGNAISEYWAHAPGPCTVSTTNQPNDTLTCPGKADGRICAYLMTGSSPTVGSSQQLQVLFGPTSTFGATLPLGPAAPGCGPGDHPADTVAPAITGDAIPGGTLVCDKGTWTGDTPQQYTYQWFKNGSLVSTDPTYTPTTADVGASFVCEVTATNPEGDTANAFSANVTVTATGGGGTGGAGGGTGTTPSAFVLAFKARTFIAEGLVKPLGTQPFVHVEYVALLHVTGADYSGGPATATLPPNANSVTFNGIPILAPVTAGNVRAFRITNVRANTTAQLDIGMKVPLPLLGPGQFFRIPESLAIGADGSTTPLASLDLAGALVYPKGHLRTPRADPRTDGVRAPLPRPGWDVRLPLPAGRRQPARARHGRPERGRQARHRDRRGQAGHRLGPGRGRRLPLHVLRRPRPPATRGATERRLLRPDLAQGADPALLALVVLRLRPRPPAARRHLDGLHPSDHASGDRRPERARPVQGLAIPLRVRMPACDVLTGLGAARLFGAR